MTIHNDFPLSEILWYEVGPKARYLLECTNKCDVLDAMAFLERNHITRFFLLGRGSNLIFSESYFDGVVIHLSRPQRMKPDIIQKENGIVDAFSGEDLDEVIQFAFANNLTGLEWAGGLPGTVGAAVRGNVGAFGKEIKDNFSSCEVLELEGTSFVTSKLTKDMLQFSYRNSLIKQKKNLLVLSTTFQLTDGDSDALRYAQIVYNDNITYRKAHHPLEYPTCGSIFKNITDKVQVEKIISVWPDISELVDSKWFGKVSMGYVIKRLGFSGYQVGQMQISEKHCNFIVNLGEAKAQEVLTIISEIKQKMSETFDFIPEVEVEIVNE